MTDINLQPIHETDWDYLIILDACRCNTFKKLYKNYNNLKQGKLEKRNSKGFQARTNCERMGNYSEIIS